MQFRNALKILGTVLIVTTTQSAHAESFYSVTSLTVLCANDANVNACKSYLHGVVETWELKDIVSVNPDRYLSSGNKLKPTFCETINKVSDSEWVAIVRSNLNTMEPGFASNAVMVALSNRLCK